MGMNVGAWLFGGVWVIGWSFVTLFFDVMLIHGAVQQLRSQHWPTAQGRVASSEVVVESDSEGGTSYTPKIRYSYSVDGVNHQNDRIRYGFSISGKRAARAAVEMYPRGNAVTVHYNPQTPSQVVLDTTVTTGSDLFGTIFMLPFNLIMLASWHVASGAIRGWSETSPAGTSVKLIEEYGGVRVRLCRFGALGTAMAAAGLTAFILVFVIAFGFGFNSIYAAAAGWAVIIGVSTITYRKMRTRIADGWYDLVIHDGRQSLTLAPSLKRPEVGEIRFEDVTAVDVVRRAGSGDDSDSFHPMLRWGSRSVELMKTSDKKAAEALAGWLRSRVGVDMRSAESPAEIGAPV
jgi:hypothetical protein